MNAGERADRPPPDSPALDEAAARQRLDEASAALVTGLEAALPGWAARSAEHLLAAWGALEPARRDKVVADARRAGEEGARRIAAELSALLALDPAEQRATPLEIIRGAVAEPTAVLSAAGLPDVVRDPFEERAWPDDRFGLVPRTLRDLDPDLAAIHFAWGVAKASLLRARNHDAFAGATTPVMSGPMADLPADQAGDSFSGKSGGEPFLVSPSDLLRWAEALAGVARTGLGFTENLYERERFEEVLKVAADIRYHALEEVEAGVQIEEWISSVGKGVPGYVTPKTAVGAVVGNEAGELLLVQRAGTGVWLYPTGWADIGYSPSEVAIKEVEEETGIQVEPVALMAVFDGMRLGFHSIPLYSLIFHCRMTGGALKPHPLECLDVGFFARGNLPEPLAGSGLWVDMAFAAIEGRQEKTFFDLPREPTWRTRPDDES